MKNIGIIKWSARISALFILVIWLLFYFWYWNPLPFINPNYTWIENAWLTLFPLVFIWLAIWWKYEKIAWYIIIISVLFWFIAWLVAKASFPINTLIVLLPWVLYLIYWYKK